MDASQPRTILRLRKSKAQPSHCIDFIDTCPVKVVVSYGNEEEKEETQRRKWGGRAQTQIFSATFLSFFPFFQIYTQNQIFDF